MIAFLIVSPSTTSTVESTVSLIEASSIDRFTLFKDWIEKKLFVHKTSGVVRGIIQPKLLYCNDLDGWPEIMNCTCCKRGETVRSIVESIDWIAVFSGQADANDMVFDGHSKEIFAKARNAVLNSFSDDSIKSYILNLVSFVTRICCCPNHLQKVRGLVHKYYNNLYYYNKFFHRYIPTSSKQHPATTMKVEIWEQIAGGKIGDKTIDTCVLSVHYLI